MTDGKKTKRLKQLEGEDFNTRILNEGKLIVTINENDETQLAGIRSIWSRKNIQYIKFPLHDRKKFTDGGGFPVSILEKWTHLFFLSAKK